MVLSYHSIKYIYYEQFILNIFFKDDILFKLTYIDCSEKCKILEVVLRLKDSIIIYEFFMTIQERLFVI